MPNHADTVNIMTKAVKKMGFCRNDSTELRDLATALPAESFSPPIIIPRTTPPPPPINPGEDARALERLELDTGGNEARGCPPNPPAFLNADSKPSRMDCFDTRAWLCVNVSVAIPCAYLSSSLASQLVSSNQPRQINNAISVSHHRCHFIIGQIIA